MSPTPDADYLKSSVGDTLKKMLLKVAVSARDDGVDPINLLSKLLFSEADAIDARKARADLKEEEGNAVQAVADEKEAAEKRLVQEAIEAAAAAKVASVADSEQGTYGWMSTMYPSSISTFATFLPEPEPVPEAAEGEADENTTLEGGTTAPVDGDEDAAPAAEGEGGDAPAGEIEEGEGDAPAAEGEEGAAEEAPAATEEAPAAEEAAPAEEAAAEEAAPAAE